MKKEYILPMVKVVCVDAESLMQTSDTVETEVGGNTDHFDAKQHDYSFDE